MSHIMASVASNELDIKERKKEFADLLQHFSNNLSDPAKRNHFETHHGSIVALGYLIGRLQYRSKTSIIDAQLIARCIELICDQLSHNNSTIVIAALNALGEAGRYNLLPVGEAGDHEHWKLLTSILEKQFKIVKDAKEHKVQEAAITSLSHIALGSVNHPNVLNDGKTVMQQVVDFLFTLSPLFGKAVEVHFTIGEALAVCAGGWAATPTAVYLDIADVDQAFVKSSFERTDLISGVVDKIMTELSTTTTSPIVKKSFCIWLLSLTKFCGAHNGLQPRLAKIHEVFSTLLGDRDEFTQDCSSKGIGLVYELGNADLKKELVGSLVSTLADGRKIQPQSVNATTQLFGEQTLGNSPDGSSITTYQSILSLASDMNQPEIVYKFMNLASHQAVWNSRRGASLGFGNIMCSSMAMLAAEQLKPYLKTLVPRLYRFQFDPNAKVADSMRNIWKSLIKEPKKAIDEHYEIIIKDLLAGLGDSMWRTREASASALADILHGRDIAQVEPYLQEIWSMSFRALDDIKESVRVSALATCKSLTNLTVRYCDPHHVSVSQGQKIIDIVMPFFLKKGLFSIAEDVRKFSLATIIKITKKAGVLLKPHISDLVTVLLEGLSSLEPQVMNYLSFHTEKYDITQTQLDATRLTAAKMSPIMEAVESSITQLDITILNDLVPKLCHLIRKGVGLPTKAGCARYIITLTLAMPLDLKLHADSILQALSGVVGDRSIPVRKSFASAAGYIAKLCSEGALSRFILHLKKMYIENDQVDTRSIPGIVLLECSRHANDATKRFSTEVLPLAFYGSRDPQAEISSVWKLIWEDLSAGAATSTTKLYTKEIVELSVSTLEQSPSWPIKKQVGLTMSQLCIIVEEAGFREFVANVIPPIISALSGRTWEGKESVLEALCTVCITCKSWVMSNPAVMDEVVKVAIREMRKNNKAYKRYGLDVVPKLIDALGVDQYEEVKEYLFEVAQGDDDIAERSSEPMDIEELRERPMNLVIQAHAMKALGRVWPTVAATQSKFGPELVSFLVKNLNGNVWNVRIGVLETLEQYCQKTETLGTKDMVLEMIKTVCLTLHDQKYSAIRTSGAAVLRLLVEKSVKEALDHIMKMDLIEELASVVDKEKMPVIAEDLRGTIALLSA